ncbi:CDP-alcohol phosphatidyltransferase family protein [Henriciella sp.]|uniref:CDP-alcohol phosphatidyltransferase family protein n=1 Tax=Henriciella sp. TaxID=1968823 RepID=UPI00260C1761|nr:CDP-alcohol phosphatidyltransferase family protein [Henriciella sp.]
MSLKWLPNTVTILRCALALVVGYMLLEMDGDIRSGQTAGGWLFLPFAVFVFTAATDWLDGALARALNAESRFGARLDPIADKLLAASTLVALAYMERWAWFILLPALVIIGRDFLMTAVREAMGNPSTLKVSPAAKWKTAVVLTSLASVLLGIAFSYLAAGSDPYSVLWVIARTPWIVGMLGLWIAAVMSVMTATNYVSALARG